MVEDDRAAVPLGLPSLYASAGVFVRVGDDGGDAIAGHERVTHRERLSGRFGARHELGQHEPFVFDAFLQVAVLRRVLTVDAGADERDGSPPSASAVLWAKVSMPLASPAMTPIPRLVSMRAQSMANCAPSGVHARDPTTLTAVSFGMMVPDANRNGGTSMVMRSCPGNLGSNTDMKSYPWRFHSSSRCSAILYAFSSLVTNVGDGGSSSSVPWIAYASFSSRSRLWADGSRWWWYMRSALPSRTQSFAIDVQVSGFSHVSSSARRAALSRLSHCSSVMPSPPRLSRHIGLSCLPVLVLMFAYARYMSRTVTFLLVRRR